MVQRTMNSLLAQQQASASKPAKEPCVLYFNVSARMTKGNVYKHVISDVEK